MLQRDAEAETEETEVVREICILLPPTALPDLAPCILCPLKAPRKSRQPAERQGHDIAINRREIIVVRVPRNVLFLFVVVQVGNSLVGPLSLRELCAAAEARVQISERRDVLHTMDIVPLSALVRVLALASSVCRLLGPCPSVVDCERRQ